jgi:acyl-CoA reductase-like NAD-dependent aldehyde dehydrogenase
MANAGQTCIAVERIYVVDDAYDAFLDKLTEKARDLRPGFDREAAYGPITMPGQLDVIERHIQDALARGATAVVGGAESVRRPYVEPVVLTDVPDDSSAVREETFGPTITVHRVRDLDEAVEKANETAYGLAGTIYSGDRSRAMDAARRMRSGMTSINAFAAYAQIPALPFGGVGESGFGRIHGPDGLREFARAKVITRQWFASMNLTSFTRTDKELNRALGLITMLHARRYKR